MASKADQGPIEPGTLPYSRNAAFQQAIADVKEKTPATIDELLASEAK